MSIAPVVATVEVKASPARAFELFTSRMSDWWVGATAARKPFAAITAEPFAGGRWFERSTDGEETLWGKVLAWEPPSRVVFGWQLDASYAYDPAIVTEVEVSFTPIADGGTRVRLEHRGLHVLGADAERVVGQIGQGWPTQLAGFAAHIDQLTEAAHG